MASHNIDSVDLTSSPVEVKEEAESSVRKCRAKSQNIFLETGYRELQRTAKQLGLPCNLKKVMLRELVRAQIEGDQDEVDCILAEAKDMKERAKREKQKKRDSLNMQIIKQELDEQWTEVKTEYVPQGRVEPPTQVHSLTEYLQSLVRKSVTPNVTIRRIRKTEMHTEYLESPVDHTRCPSYMQNSTKHVSATYVPHPQQLIANSSNYLVDKTKFSPKLMHGGSCSSKPHPILQRQLPVSKSSVTISTRPKSAKLQTYSASKPSGSCVLKRCPCPSKVMSNLSYLMRDVNKQKLQISQGTSNSPQTLSDSQVKYSFPSTSSVGSNNSKSQWSYSPSSNMFKSYECPVNYPVSAAYTDNQMIYQSEAIPVNVTTFTGISVNQNQTNLIWSVSKFNSDQSRFNNFNQVERNGLAPSTYHENPLMEKPKPKLWKLPGTTEQDESIQGHHIVPPKVPGYYNFEYLPSCNYQWNSSTTTVLNQPLSYGHQGLFPSRQNILPIHQYNSELCSSMPALREPTSSLSGVQEYKPVGKIWPSTQVCPNTAIYDHSYSGNMCNVIKCKTLTVEETITKNPLWEPNSEAISEPLVNKLRYKAVDETLGFSNQFCKIVDDGGKRNDKENETVENFSSVVGRLIDELSCDSSEALPKIDKLLDKQVDEMENKPLGRAEGMYYEQFQDSGKESFHNHSYHESTNKPLPFLHSTLQNSSQNLLSFETERNESYRNHNYHEGPNESFPSLNNTLEKSSKNDSSFGTERNESYRNHNYHESTDESFPSLNNTLEKSSKNDSSFGTKINESYRNHNYHESTNESFPSLNNTLVKSSKNDLSFGTERNESYRNHNYHESTNESFPSLNNTLEKSSKNDSSFGTERNESYRNYNYHESTNESFPSLNNTLEKSSKNDSSFGTERNESYRNHNYHESTNESFPSLNNTLEKSSKNDLSFEGERNESFQNQFFGNDKGLLPSIQSILKNRLMDLKSQSEHNVNKDYTVKRQDFAQTETGSSVPGTGLDCLANTALFMCQQVNDYPHYREKLNEISRTLSTPYHQNGGVATRNETPSKDIPTWNSFLQQATADQPVYCQYGCKTVFRTMEQQVHHEMSCLLRVIWCPTEFCSWMNCIQSLASHIFYAHRGEVVMDPETHFNVRFINYKTQRIDNPSLLEIKRFSFYQSVQERLFVIKVAVDQANLNVQAYVQYINDGLEDDSFAVLEVCCPDGIPVRWVGSVYPFSFSPVHIVSSMDCLKFNMSDDAGWGNNFSLHVKLRSFSKGTACKRFPPFKLID